MLTEFEMITMTCLKIKFATEDHDKQARKLQATLFRNYDRVTDWLTDGGEV